MSRPRRRDACARMRLLNFQRRAPAPSSLTLVHKKWSARPSHAHRRHGAHALLAAFRAARMPPPARLTVLSWSSSPSLLTLSTPVPAAHYQPNFFFFSGFGGSTCRALMTKALMES